MTIACSPIARDDADSYRECLDAVARERKYLALLEAPPPDAVRGFVADTLAHGWPQWVAKDDGRVVGWCDVFPAGLPSLAHCGTLGMGLLAAYRGRGIGRELLRACTAAARAQGMSRVELEVRTDNVAAIALYAREGFRIEGLKRAAMRVDGVEFDLLVMAHVDAR